MVFRHFGRVPGADCRVKSQRLPRIAVRVVVTQPSRPVPVCSGACVLGRYTGHLFFLTPEEEGRSVVVDRFAERVFRIRRSVSSAWSCRAQAYWPGASMPLGAALPHCSTSDPLLRQYPPGDSKAVIGVT
jgi:hypothetical protein